MSSQTSLRRAAMAGLFAALIACGGKASVSLPLTPVPVTQQLLFALLAGALLGSRLGALSASLYLCAAAFASQAGFLGLWPSGAGDSPLTGPFSGYLWSLPAAAYLAGYAVERVKSEQPVVFAIGATAGVGLYSAAGTLRLLGGMEWGFAETFAKGAALFIGQHAAHVAITVMVASSVSNRIQAHERK